MADKSECTQRLQQAILLLECALPHFRRLAATERDSYPGHGLREITHQERLSAVLEIINAGAPNG